jgi:D-3-phosphoglycerate dehydrogenase / 2-oxoglutarate reductase
MAERTILIAESRFDPEARAVLAAAGEVVDFDTFDERLPDADALVAGLEVAFTADVLARAPRLRVIASRTSQLRHVDLDEAKRRGIDVLFIDPQDPLLQETSSTAEEAWALLLALVRNVPWAFDALKAGRWERARYGGHELKGKTLGLIGFGRLGRMVARYAQAFELEVLASDPNVGDDEIRAAGCTPTKLDDLLARVDVVSIHCTFSEDTRGLIGARELELMKPSAVLVNTARGEITDEAALLAALERGTIRGAAVDTLSGETGDGSHLRDNSLVAYARAHENLIVLPHLGGATEEATARTQRYISRRLVEHLEART